MSKLNQQFQLLDGCKLGYDERGPADGKPLFYFHGSPSSRVESMLYVNDELLHSLNVRLIVADRPGMGLSDFQPNRQILDLPKDILALADQRRKSSVQCQHKVGLKSETGISHPVVLPREDV